MRAAPAGFVHVNSNAGSSVTDKSSDSNGSFLFIADDFRRMAKFLDFGGNLRCNEAVVAVN
jgi:hypothetical protein